MILSKMARRSPRTFTAADVKNQFGEALQAVADEGVIAITRYGKVEAYVLSPERYGALTGEPERELDLLTEYFDELVAQMQGPKARAAARAAFEATPEDLGRAAVEGARRRAAGGD